MPYVRCARQCSNATAKDGRHDRRRGERIGLVAPVGSGRWTNREAGRDAGRRTPAARSERESFEHDSRTRQRRGRTPRRGQPWSPPPAAGSCPMIPARLAARPGRRRSAAAVAAVPWHGAPFTVDIPVTGSLLSSAMSEIARAIANRQSTIDRLQAEIGGGVPLTACTASTAPPRAPAAWPRSSPTRPSSRRTAAPRSRCAWRTPSAFELDG